MVSLLLGIIYIAFISLGLPGLPDRVGVAVMHAELGIPGVLCRDSHHDHCGRHHRFQPAFRPADRKLGTGLVTALQRFAHGGGPVRLFYQPVLCSAVPVGGALWTGGGSGGRGAQQLCGPALCLPSYELAALLLGRGGRRSVLIS